MLLARGSLQNGFRIGLAFGLGFFGALLIWISVVGWIAWALLVVMEALFVGLFGAAWAHVSRLERWTWIVAAPALWVTTETLRASVPVVGFPWGELAQSQGPFPWLLQISQLGGGKTVSFVLIAVNALVAIAWLARGRARYGALAAAAITIAALAPLSTVWPWIDGVTDENSEVLRIAIIQGNASPGVVREDEFARVERHLHLTRSLAEENLDLVVWPESAVGIDPYTNFRVMGMLGQAALSVQAPMIVGANLERSGNRYQVVTLLVDQSGEIVETYAKTHLVPFGEYVPLRSALGWIPMLEQVPRDAIASDLPKNFILPPTEGAGEERIEPEIATVISFEGDFGHLVRERVDMGARLITVATNTSTWKHTWASAQHVAMSQVRAAENRVPVIHAALSGISAWIGSDGVVHDPTPLYKTAVVVFDVATATDISLYARTGEWLPILCTAFSVGAMAIAYRRRGSVPR